MPQVKLTGDVAEMKAAAEAGDAVGFKDAAQRAASKLREAEKAARQNDAEALRKAAEDAGIRTGFLQDVLFYVNVVKAIIDLINAGLNVFVNGPDEVEATVPAQTYLPELGVAHIMLRANLQAPFKGWVLGDNYQDFTVSAGLEVRNGVADSVQLFVETTAIGVFQDGIDLMLEVDQITGSQAGSPAAYTRVVTAPGVELQNGHFFGFRDLQRVTLHHPQAARVNYGLDGALVGLVVRATATGTIRGGSGFSVTVANAKYGISV